MYKTITLLKARVPLYNVRHMSVSQNKAFVDNSWIPANSGKTFDVINPYDGSVISQVPDMDENDALKAIKCAHTAFHTWQHTTAKERSHLLRSWYDILVNNEATLAKIITAEAGKPIKESLGEVQYGNSFVEWFAEEARRISGEILSSPTRTKEMMLIKQPIGVAALITPWNFPIAMITRKAAAALAAGCTCVVKPAEDTPLTALALAHYAEQAGFPNGVFNVVTCSRENAPSVGKLLCESGLVAGISFTGSTVVGKTLYKQCAVGVKRIALELGGNAPFLVFESADLDKAVEGAMASKFRNCGQTCVSANRFLIQESVFNLFVSKMKQAMQKQLILGNGEDKTKSLGPLINDVQAGKVHAIVEDAIKKGANVLAGGKPALNIGARFYEPTLLTNINKNMICYSEEIFGPVVICLKFKTEEEAIAIANDTKSGLAAYFYSGDIPQIWRVSKKLDVGMIGINEGLISSAEAAFGGIKESGIGREGSHHGIEEFTYVKYLCLGNL